MIWRLGPETRSVLIGANEKTLEPCPSVTHACRGNISISIDCWVQFYCQKQSPVFSVCVRVTKVFIWTRRSRLNTSRDMTDYRLNDLDLIKTASHWWIIGLTVRFSSAGLNSSRTQQRRRSDPKTDQSRSTRVRVNHLRRGSAFSHERRIWAGWCYC